jgi:catechol 2,3-dioxygenase-like lactoylglutathione lyase family enzyme
LNLNQVTLPATNVERSAEFYRALGFTQIVSDLPSYARFECPEGEATFSLHLADSVPASGVVVYFECQDIDAVCSALAERGIAFDSTPTDQSWLWREAYLRDPDGNVLCLYHAGANRRHPPWRLGQGAEASGQSDQLPPPHLRG